MASTQPDALPSHRVCYSCGKPEGEPRLKTCATCSTALYCSRDCQTAHWKIHKKECRKPNSNMNEQPHKTQILGPWDEKLYKATTPSSFLHGKPTPETVKEISEKLPDVTRCIYENPQNPIYLQIRAEYFSKLGFADLAAGDAYKAIQLLDTRLRRILGDSRSNYENLSGIPLDLNAAAAQATDLQKSSYSTLLSSLAHTQNRTTAQVMVQEARIRYPSSPDFEKIEGYIVIGLQQSEKQKQLLKSTKAVGYDPRFGGVYHVAYPFIPKAFLSRSEDLIQTANKEIQTEAKELFAGCALRSSTVQDPADSTSNGAPKALGIFATRDIPEYAPFLIDTTVLAATENHGRTSDAIEICDNCCGTIPRDSTEKRSASCCTVLYCSQKCKDLAWKYYHQVLCKQDFSWVWDDSKTGEARYDLDGPMWLRILAVCVQSKSHPLEHPLIARLTPLYDEHTYRRWSLSNNIITPIKILQQLGVDTYADSRFDPWVLQTLWTRNVTNCHEAGSTSGGRTVRAINPYYSFLNHSCEPNANFSTSIMVPELLSCRDGSQLYLYAAKKIKKGEEISISYWPFKDETKEERRLTLISWIGTNGQCGCRKCVEES